jgi:predicted transglutaminase-like cysteine proteinase
MHRFLIIAAAALSLIVGCNSQSATAKFCLSAEGTSQDCGIACKIEKGKDVCDKWAEKTKALCPKLTKAECQEICVKDENPTACELAKAMK